MEYNTPTDGEKIREKPRTIDVKEKSMTLNWTQLGGFQLRMWSHPFIIITSRFTLSQSGRNF